MPSVQQKGTKRSMNDQNKSPAELIKEALDGVSYMRGLSSKEVAGLLKSRDAGPYEVPISDEGFVWITANGMRAIKQQADQWRSNSYKAKLHLSAKMAQDLVLRQFGAMLLQLSSNASDAQATSFVAFAEELTSRVDTYLDASFVDVHFYFPCRVLDNASIGPIDVGAVQFLPLLDWLDQVDRRAAPKVLPWTAPLRSFLSTPFTSMPERNLALEQLPEAAASKIRMLSGCQWVASVGLKAANAARARDRAATAVRLAIDVLGLLMNRTGASGLRGPGDELRSKETCDLFQTEKGDVLENWSMDLPNAGGSRRISEQYLEDTANLRSWAGKAITVVIEPSSALGAKEPTIAQRLCDAIFWFGEARRDRTEFMALVRYGMALDVLAKGSKKKGIITLIENLAELKGNDKVMGDTSLEKLISQIYDEGRSQFGHGGRAALIQDLPASVEAADSLTAKVIALYASCYAHYSGDQNYHSFLKAIPDCLKQVKESAVLVE